MTTVQGSEKKEVVLPGAIDQQNHFVFTVRPLGDSHVFIYQSREYTNILELVIERKQQASLRT